MLSLAENPTATWCDTLAPQGTAGTKSLNCSLPRSDRERESEFLFIDAPPEQEWLGLMMQELNAAH